MTWQDHIDHISVSQIKTHERNPRRWALQKLLKLPACDSPYTVIGKTIHDDMERYLQGKLTIEDMTFEHSRDFAIEWEEKNDVNMDQAILVEHQIDIPLRPSQPPLLGYIDVVVPDYKGYPMIIDHKTSRTRRFFVKEEDLREDTQLLVYAYWASQALPNGGKGVWIQHNQFAYGLKKDKLRIVRDWVSREEIAKAMDRLADEIDAGLIQTVAEYERTGEHGQGTERCRDCRCAFGPKSCEYAAICDGYATSEQYKDNFTRLHKERGKVYIMDIHDALDDTPLFEPLESLTKKDTDAIMKEKESSMTNIMDLSEFVKKARDKFSNVNNTWDRREAMTKAVVKHVVDASPDMVLLPAHFIGGSVDPDYQPIVTQLKENDINLAVIM